MPTTDIQTQKLALIQNILALEDEQVLLLIRELLESALASKKGASKEDFWQTLPTKLKADILESIHQMDTGRGIPHAAVMDEIKQRYVK